MHLVLLRFMLHCTNCIVYCCLLQVSAPTAQQVLTTTETALFLNCLNPIQA